MKQYNKHQSRIKTQTIALIVSMSMFTASLYIPLQKAVTAHSSASAYATTENKNAKLQIESDNQIEYTYVNAQNLTEISEKEKEYTNIYPSEKTAYSIEYNAADTEKTDVEVNTEPTTAQTKQHNGIYEGDIITGELTFYCVCIKCCGKTDGVTASGIVLKNGIEPEIPIVSCNWLPFDTIVEIDNVQYIVADKGGKAFDKAGRLDVFEWRGHEQALQNGRVKNIEITVVKLP